MLTLFSIPKGFSGSTALAQENAIESWSRLSQRCEIILFGDDPGVAEAAARFGARHESGLGRTPQGTATLSTVFERADAIASNPILCFINTDIILLEDFITATKLVASRHEAFLMIASRFNCCIDGRLRFGANWEQQLRYRVRAENKMYPSGGSDIFVYRPGLFRAVPPFAVGRGFWDNWLIYEAHRQKVPLIDATQAATLVHQDHSYEHVAGIPAGTYDDQLVYEMEEAQRNLRLAGGKRHIYTAFDATEVLTERGQLLSTLRPSLIFRRIKATVRRTFS